MLQRHRSAPAGRVGSRATRFAQLFARGGREVAETGRGCSAACDTGRHFFELGVQSGGVSCVPRIQRSGGHLSVVGTSQRVKLLECVEGGRVDEERQEGAAVHVRGGDACNAKRAASSTSTCV